MPTDQTATPDTTHVAVPVVVNPAGDPHAYRGVCTQGDFQADRAHTTPAAAKADVAEHVAAQQ